MQQMIEHLPGTPYDTELIHRVCEIFTVLLSIQSNREVIYVYLYTFAFMLKLDFCEVP